MYVIDTINRRKSAVIGVVLSLLELNCKNGIDPSTAVCDVRTSRSPHRPCAGRGAPLSALAGRLLQTAAAAATRVDKTQLSRLRKKTGFPFIKCKNALQQFDNDLPQVHCLR